MSDASERVNIGRLILWPAVITLAITILRLVGELEHWSPTFFSPAPGGGNSLVGISWLPLIFGPYFGLKLAGAGEGPASVLRPILMPLVGLAVIAVAGFAASAVIGTATSITFLIVICVAAWIATLLQRSAWPALFKTLIAYAFAARIPVALVMLIAMRGNWGTHYDVPPTPDFPITQWFMKWLVIGALPQFAIWIAYTAIVGFLLGGITAAITRRRAGEQQPASA